ncbi:MAG: lipid-A-disaccharide synthase N-terminal domain-containing protein [Gammaproteobacteria bacterium]
MGGNLLFFSRWVVQWVASERARRSVIPVAFWYLSIAGSLVLLCYALYRRDPVFIVSQLPNSIIYLRNLHLLRHERQVGEAP